MRTVTQYMDTTVKLARFACLDEHLADRNSRRSENGKAHPVDDPRYFNIFLSSH